MSRRDGAIGVVAVLAALAIPGTAPGAVVTKDAATFEITYTGTDSFDSFLLEPGFVFMRNPNGTDITAGTGCSDDAVMGNSATCPSVPTPGRIVIRTFGGDDYLGVYPELSTSALTVAYGGDGNDILSGGGGNAQELYGEAGDDDLYPIEGVQTAFGGDGNDDFGLLSNGDVVSGGEGVDTFDGSFFASLDRPVQVSLDGVANDGPVGSPGIRANVLGDIENVSGLDQNDVLVGNASANRLDGGKGADTLDGGPGPDTLIGGDGDDEIAARDGFPDQVDCGLGVDIVIADVEDDIGPGCDRVELPLPGPAPPSPGPSETATPAAAPSTVLIPPLARVNAPVSSAFNVYARYTTVRTLVVRRVPAGGRVTVRCRGRGCPFGRRRVAVRRGSATLTALFHRRRLRPGAVIEIRITVPNAVGKFVRFRMRDRRLPASAALCLPPGQRRPARCR
jgi:hypothetical protein